MSFHLLISFATTCINKCMNWYIRIPSMETRKKIVKHFSCCKSRSVDDNLQIYKISKSRSITFIIAMILLSHIKVTFLSCSVHSFHFNQFNPFQSTSVHFSSLLSILVHFDLFSLFRSTFSIMFFLFLSPSIFVSTLLYIDEFLCFLISLLWIDIVGFKDRFAGPNYYLGSQFIYLVSLGILPWVVLS